MKPPGACLFQAIWAGLPKGIPGVEFHLLKYVKGVENL